MNIYVGNLSVETTEDDLRKLFGEFGQVTEVKIIKDRDTYQSRGFGFVEIPNASSAKQAIADLNGSEYDGNVLTVNEARPREERGNRSFGGGGNRGSSGGYGNGGGRKSYGGGGDRGGRRY